MRAALLVTLAGLAVGCGTPEPVDGFRYRSTLDVPTRGVILHTDGDIGHAGMFSTNCPFETNRGSVTGDYDLPGSDEMIDDAGTSHLGPTSVIAVQPHDGVLHVFDKDEGVYDVQSYEVPGVLQGRFFSDGFVARTGTEVQWRDFDGDVVASTPASLAEGAMFDVDPRSAAAYFGGADARVVTPDGVSSMEASGSLLSVDIHADVVYVADRGDDVVRALALDGTLLWEAQVPGEVRALAHAGDLNEVAVILAVAEGRGALTYLDAVEGRMTAWQETPEPADGIAVSEDGSTVAFIVDRAVHFFRNAGF